MTSVESVAQPRHIVRPREGRVLGGVCAGLARVRDMEAPRWRQLFVLAALCGGIGIVVYLACLLVMPASDSPTDAEDDAPRSVVVVAWAAGGFVVLVLAAGSSAVLTVFGLGWVIVAIAAAVMVLAAGPLRSRIPRTVALTLTVALTVPAVAVAISPVRLNFDLASHTTEPATATQVSGTAYRSGFGTEFIDLRHTRFPSSGTVNLRIDAGVRRTLIALPHDTCVHVRVHYAFHTFASQLATLLSGHQLAPFHAVVAFGDVFGSLSGNVSGEADAATSGSGPTLRIAFESQGGSLFVRDYPDSVDPSVNPYWPGFVGGPEAPPYLGDETRAARRQMLAAYHRRLRTEIASEHRIDALEPGPCGS